MEVLLFRNTPGAIVLHPGEKHKEGAVRWLREQHKLGLLDVETVHIVKRDATSTGGLGLIAGLRDVTVGVTVVVMLQA